jgi:transcriptional regulator with XRE-family HTH domain
MTLRDDDDDFAELTEFYADMGQRMRKIRNDRGMTLKTLAEGSGLRQSYLAEVERSGANVTLKTLYLISRELGIDVSQLFTSTSPAQAERTHLASVVKARVTILRRQMLEQCDGILKFVDPSHR